MYSPLSPSYKTLHYQVLHCKEMNTIHHQALYYILMSKFHHQILYYMYFNTLLKYQ